ncbi:MAG: ribonuclease VapC [Candidatus Nanoarchaeia archaeon]
MKRIVLDTNFVIEVAKNKIDLKKEIGRILDYPYKIFIVKGVAEELNKIIKEQKGKNKEAAKLALSIIKGIKNLETEGKSVDEKLANLSDKNTIIATQDKQLKKKIKGQVITVRQKKYLQLL